MRRGALTGRVEVTAVDEVVKLDAFFCATAMEGCPIKRVRQVVGEVLPILGTILSRLDKSRKKTSLKMKGFILISLLNAQTQLHPGCR